MPLQRERFLEVATPLGQDVLVLLSFRGWEELSQPFVYELELYSDNTDIKPDDIVGQNVSFLLRKSNETYRYFNGYVRQFRAIGADFESGRLYQAKVVPWFWFLLRTADCQIFQEMSAGMIVEKIFQDHGFSDYELQWAGGSEREYCVQYRETDFNFVSRLLEEEGAFYYFRHENGRHILVVADNAGKYLECEERTITASAGDHVKDHISSWSREYAYRSGKVAIRDFDFKKPASVLSGASNSVVDYAGKDFELYDYPGGFVETADGRRVADLRMEEEETPVDRLDAQSNCRTIGLACMFSLDGEFSADKKDYVVTKVSHSAHGGGYSTGESESEDYSNEFACIPADRTFRPPRVTPKPIVPGPQTAIVVGPAGEEIYIDEFARVKLQFHWDRYGKADEKSSCWVRVSQSWAGNQWGAFFWPRIGQEVVVDFLEGDPDRPLITGRVYNGDQKAPYVPEQTLSGFKSNSSKGGKGSNEFRFEDKKGSEQVYLHAEKDYQILVDNDKSETVKNSKSIKVDGSHKETIKNDTTITVTDGSMVITVAKGDATFEVTKGNLDRTVGSDVTDNFKANQTVTVGNALEIQAATVKVSAQREILLSVGGNSVKIDMMGVTILGTLVKIN